jgi:hypothetical protein
MLRKRLDTDDCGASGGKQALRFSVRHHIVR